MDKKPPLAIQYMLQPCRNVKQSQVKPKCMPAYQVTYLRYFNLQTVQVHVSIQI